jgi:hypothetical protein
MPGAITLADVIKDMRALTTLDVSSNYIPFELEGGIQIQRICAAGGIQIAMQTALDAPKQPASEEPREGVIRESGRGACGVAGVWCRQGRWRRWWWWSKLLAQPQKILEHAVDGAGRARPITPPTPPR